MHKRRISEAEKRFRLRREKSAHSKANEKAIHRRVIWERKIQADGEEKRVFNEKITKKKNAINQRQLIPVAISINYVCCFSIFFFISFFMSNSFTARRKLYHYCIIWWFRYFPSLFRSIFVYFNLFHIKMRILNRFKRKQNVVFIETINWTISIEVRNVGAYDIYLELIVILRYIVRLKLLKNILQHKQRINASVSVWMEYTDEFDTRSTIKRFHFTQQRIFIWSTLHLENSSERVFRAHTYTLYSSM